MTISATAYISQLRAKIKTQAKQIAGLRTALQAAKSHLDYTGYGDKWERECAEAQKLEQKIDRALELSNEN